ncbi:6-hydroxymethylpterin diphosphokinase MptE-like protein [Draconibacterium mangrovi]|uniref:6-hydroxymethylpterin diphosphokinase MptE-like protein n=1 Tax=Draconibacterium mangrovi TaxID=2697469 RepID=UPI0013D23550|nr:6-hydroxymethylpterin diphosphokinase MptE-like protein [Draconibacterium mangrovi]
MNSFILKASNILKNDGLFVFIKRLYNFSLVKLKRLYLKKDFGEWDKLKNKYKGKRIFILGNGPSLNKTQLHYLKDEYTMCFNRVNLMLERLNWTPNFYVMTDDLLIKDMYSEVKKEILPKVTYAFFPDLHPSNVNFRKRIGTHNNVFYLNTDIPEFRTDLPRCGINKTVVNAGMQIAAYLGFAEIYLLGVDMTFGEQKVQKSNSREWKAVKDDDPNHFDPRYFGKGRRYHNPTVHEMLEQFDIGRKFFANLGIKVINAGVGGKLESFQRIDYCSLFQYTEEDKERLYMRMVFPDQLYTSFNKCIEEIPSLKNIDEFVKKMSLFSVDVEMLAEFMQVAIQTHIPFGPYKGKYIFKKR